MQNNSARLAMALMGSRQDMASHSYNTAGTMRANMGSVVNGQPSLPTPMASMQFVNLNRGTTQPPTGHAKPKGLLPDGYAGMGTTKAPDIGKSTNEQHLNDMGNNPAHPAAQLASYLITNKLTHPSMFYRG